MKNAQNVFDVCMMRLTDEKYYDLVKVDPDEMLTFFKNGGDNETDFSKKLV